MLGPTKGGHATSLHRRRQDRNKALLDDLHAWLFRQRGTLSRSFAS